MPDEGQERGDSFDDLFEDLDKFFAPGDSGASRRRQAGAAPGSTDPAGAQSPLEGGPAGDDILPEGWQPDIDALDLGADSAERPAPPPIDEPIEGPAIEEPATEEPAIEVEDFDADLAPPSYASAGSPPRMGSGGDEPREPEEDRDQAERAPTGSEDMADQVPDRTEGHGEPTAEMTGEDWRRLRDVLGEEAEGAEEYQELDEPPASTSAESLFEDGPERAGGPAWEESGEGHELTLDDLKKAPPEYRDLPVAPTEENVAAEEAGIPAWGSEEAEIPAWEAEEAESPALESGSEGMPAQAEGDVLEPAIADVEAAADQLAAEYRDVPAPADVEEELLADLDQPTGPRTVKVGEPERLSGPTWEEPGSQPVMTESATPAAFGGRNLPLAVLTGVGLAAAALISLAIAKAAFAVVAGGVVLFGQAELYSTMHRRGHQPATALGLAVGAFTLAGAYLKGEAAMAFFLGLGVFLSFLWYMAAPPKAREGLLRNISSTMFGVLYLPFLAGYILIVLAQSSSGRALMLAILAFTFAYDIAAFMIGSFWGSRALAPTISPRKSWEGLFGATVVTFALAVAILPSIEPLTVVKSVGLALTIIVFAPLGDLAESAIKRDLGVKDMGSILPGHGGVLDRIDSVLLVAPAVFYYLRLIF